MASKSIDKNAPELEYTWVFDGITESEKEFQVDHCFTDLGFSSSGLNTFDPKIGQMVEAYHNSL